VAPIIAECDIGASAISGGAIRREARTVQWRRQLRRRGVREERRRGVDGPLPRLAGSHLYPSVSLTRSQSQSLNPLSGPVYTASDVNVIRHQYKHKSAKRHVIWRCLSSPHARTHCFRILWSDLADRIVGDNDAARATRLHRAGVSRELTGLPSLDPSGAVVRSLLVQSFLRKPKDAIGIFLSKHVHLREIFKRISRT